MNKYFKEKNIQVNEKIFLSIISIKVIDKKIQETFDKFFVKICEGNSGSNLSQVKKTVLNFLNNQSENTKIGAIAEFIAHLYLNSIGFKQECLFFNLEENSIKKGFDGIYTNDSIPWLLESKSGLHSTLGLSHKIKIKDAYNDLSNKISGFTTNNPWRNAYNHASHADVHSRKPLKDQLKQLSDNFRNKIFSNILNHNIIPSSTIFLNGIWDDSYQTNLEADIHSITNEIKAKNIRILTITKISIEEFLNYLRR